MELDPRLQITHMKEWRLGSLLYADIRYRGIPWTVLALRTGRLPNDLATRMSQRFSVWFTFLILCGGMGGVLTRGRGGLRIAALGAAGVLVTNLPFFRFLRQKQGWRLALAAPALQVVFNCCCLISLACGCFIFLRAELPHESKAKPLQILPL